MAKKNFVNSYKNLHEELTSPPKEILAQKKNQQKQAENKSPSFSSSAPKKKSAPKVKKAGAKKVSKAPAKKTMTYYFNNQNNFNFKEEKRANEENKQKKSLTKNGDYGITSFIGNRVFAELGRRKKQMINYRKNIENKIAYMNHENAYEEKLF